MTIRRALLRSVLLAACVALAPLAAAAENPCGGNPCAENPCGDNPCAGANPCAGNPCAANACNPCAGNPCNPCGAGAGVDPARFKRPADVAPASETLSAAAVARGEALWNDKGLSSNGLACSTCHAGSYGQMNASFAAPYPHEVAMPKQAAGVAEVDAGEMVNFCMIMPMASEPLAWDSEELAALSAYVQHIQKGFDASAAPAANPCAAPNPCGSNPCAAANPCSGNPCAAANPCSGNPCAAANPCAGNACAAANPCGGNPCGG